MIGYLTGKIISKKPTQIILDVNGVGYLVHISISTFEKLGDAESISLYTYLAVREDALDLYGFFTQSEKEMFELLISVSGIGPKLAQGILSGIQIGELNEAIKTGNIARLVAIPGIGRKTAERLLVELRDKVESLAISMDSKTSASYNVRNDAIAALANLGYNRANAERVVKNVIDKTPNASIEELIKDALGMLNN